MAKVAHITEAANTQALTPNLRSQVELITPKIAGEMLLSNTSNRSVSQNSVAAYASDMASGRWQLNGDPVRFSSEGVLLDGQHRLHAVVEAGIPVHMVVIRDLPPETFVTIDAGRKRTASDILGLQDVPNSSCVASAARSALLFTRGMTLNSAAISRSAITEFVAAHPYLIEAARLATSAVSARINISPLASVIFLANERRFFDDDVVSFVQGISTGAGMERGDARLTLREWATNERLRNRGSIRSGPAFSAVARAWTAYAKGDRLLVIKVNARPDRSNTQIAGFHSPDA